MPAAYVTSVGCCFGFMWWRARVSAAPAAFPATGEAHAATHAQRRCSLRVVGYWRLLILDEGLVRFVEVWFSGHNEGSAEILGAAVAGSNSAGAAQGCTGVGSDSAICNFVICLNGAPLVLWHGRCEWRSRPQTGEATHERRQVSAG